MTKRLPSAILLTFLAFVLLFVSYSTQVAKGSAPAGLPATIATSSNPTVTSTAGVVFATSTCAARTITTSASPIMITFSQNQGLVPTGTYGHLQAASTTVTYDSGQVGCGALWVYSFASQVITVSEAR